MLPSVCCAAERPPRPPYPHDPTHIDLALLCAEAVARQLRIRLEPEMVDMGGESLRAVGEYRLPLKLVLPSGDRATLDVTLAST